MIQDKKEDPTIRETVTGLIGEASMLNLDFPKSQAVVGVFDSERAMEIVDKILKVCGRDRVDAQYLEGKLKEIKDVLGQAKKRELDNDPSEDYTPALTALDGIHGLVGEMFEFMIQIRELQFGSDPGGTIPPGRSLMAMHHRIEDLEVCIRRSEGYVPVLDHLNLSREGIVQDDGGGENFRQLVSNIRAKPGLDVSDERDRALLWAAEQFEVRSLPVVRGTLKRVDDRSEDISVEFQKVIDEVATLKLSEAEAIWKDFNHADAQNSADCFAAAVKAAVGLQSDLKHVVEAASNESEEAEKLREALHRVSDALEAVQAAKLARNPITEQGHLRDAIAVTAKALTQKD